jgi:hypothetical protein
MQPDPQSTPQAGAQASASPDPLVTTPEQAVDPKPLTIADVERIADERAARIAQSMVDKAENRISKKAQEQIRALDLNKATLGLTDEQVNTAKQQIVYNDLTTLSAGAASPAAPTPPTDASDPDPVIQETLDIFAAEGVTIDTADPEYKVLDVILRDPKANIHIYRKELYKQIEAKRARVELNRTQAAARVVGGGSQATSDPGDIKNITDSKQLYRLGEEKLSKPK